MTAESGELDLTCRLLVREPAGVVTSVEHLDRGMPVPAAGLLTTVTMRVEIWSDVVCPWCYVGKRRFETAMARFDHRQEVELVWRSFELDPAAAPSGTEQGRHAELLGRQHGMSTDQARAMLDRMTETAAAEGLEFHFELSRTGNTFDAHRLLHLAREHGLQHTLKERFDHATFSEGMPSSDHAALRAHAVGVGLPAGEVDAVLASSRYANAVRADEAQAREYGISGVPFFVIDGRYGISGAQAADVVLEVLDRAWAEHESLTVVAAPAAAPAGSSAVEACDGPSCAL